MVVIEFPGTQNELVVDFFIEQNVLNSSLFANYHLSIEAWVPDQD